MNILLVSTYDGVSGAGAAIACRRLQKSLIQLGYDCRLLVLNKQSTENATQVFPFFNKKRKRDLLKKNMLKILGYFFYGNKYQLLPNGHYQHSSPASPYNIKDHELYQWADIINLHWVGGFLDYYSFFSSTLDKPIAWTLHDMNPFTGGCHHSEGCNGFTKKCNSCPQVPQQNQHYIQKNWQLKKQADYSFLTIITPSTWLKEKSASSSLFKKNTHFVIPYSVNKNIFKTQNKSFCKSLFNIKTDKKTLLFVSHDISQELKGIKFLVEAIEKLANNIEVLVIGKKNVHIAKKNLTYLGPIYDERLMAVAYNAADVFVIPSLEENLPNVIIESICCGTPVVAFAVGGIPEMIEKGENGFQAQRGSALSLKNSIENALVHEWDREKIMENAHKKYAHPVQAKRYEEIFRELVTNKA